MLQAKFKIAINCFIFNNLALTTSLACDKDDELELAAILRGGRSKWRRVCFPTLVLGHQ
jgi:hypothetical protein